MRTLLLSTVLLLGISLSSSSPADIGVQRYDGSKVLRAQATTMKQYEILLDLANNERQLDFWTDPALNDFTDIMVGPRHLQELQTYFEANGISYTVHIDDVQRIIDEQKVLAEKSNTRDMNWSSYQTIATIFEWLEDLAVQFPQLVTLVDFGRSTENRIMRVVKISTGGTNKIGFWIDATIHAREWVATSTATYIINQLITNSSSYADLLDRIDFYVLPIVNPDGYSYSHTTSRLWRKTRSNHSPGCLGVDANRNFGFQFGGPGSSNDPCSETYRGPVAYSEPETEAVRNYITSLSSTVNWQTFITLHSYSQLWMTPWGYTTDLPADYTELKRVADLGANALTAVYGTRYTTGSAANVLYHSSGSSRDWALGSGGFKYVYTLELRDTGNYGFLLPPSQIIPTAVETWTGLQVVARDHLVKRH